MHLIWGYLWGAKNLSHHIFENLNQEFTITRWLMFLSLLVLRWPTLSGSRLAEVVRNKVIASYNSFLKRQINLSSAAMTPFSACHNIPHSRLRNQINQNESVSEPLALWKMSSAATVQGARRQNPNDFLKQVFNSKFWMRVISTLKCKSKFGMRVNSALEWTAKSKCRMRDSHCESILFFQIIGRPVVVKLNSGVDYRGVNTELIII